MSSIISGIHWWLTTKLQKAIVFVTIHKGLNDTWYLCYFNSKCTTFIYYLIGKLEKVIITMWVKEWLREAKYYPKWSFSYVPNKILNTKMMSKPNGIWMMESQYTWNQCPNSNMVLRFNMSTLYFGCHNECPNQQLNTTHDLTNTIKLCCLQEMKNCHHLRQSSIFEHLKIVFAQFHIQLG